jgi:DNA-directed RNA polymerase subunit alpha
MLVKFGKTEKPRKIVIEDETATPTFARFVAEPLERVIGHSIGNALRRTLLSSLEAPGILSVKMEEVPHEYTPIPGICEDMTNIILNLKTAKLRCLPSQETSTTREPRIYSATIDVTQHDLDKNGGSIDICLKDLIQNSVFEVVNPELKICTVTKPMKKQIDLRIGYGKGYVSSERHVIPNKLVDEIVMDTAFSPVTLVNYFIENTRVGQDTDFDRLVMEVTTDGRLSPSEAVSFAAQVLITNFEVFKDLKEHELVFESLSKEGQADDDELLDKLVLRIDEIELSVRSTNCLKNAEIGTIAELVCIPEKNMLEFRNFGKKSLNEIKAKLADMGLSLGMDLSDFGITPDAPDIKEKVKELIEQRKQKKEKKKKV